MGANMTRDEFNKHYQNLLSQSLPLNICIILHRFDPKILAKIGNILTLIENKYINKKNRYAIIGANTDPIDFCNVNNFLNKLRESAQFQENNQLPLGDLYQYANLNLTWQNAAKIMLDIDFDSNNQSTSTFSKEKLTENNGITIFDLKSFNDFDTFERHLEWSEAKSIEEKYVIQYKFQKSYSSRETISYRGVLKLNFPKDLLRNVRTMRDFTSVLNNVFELTDRDLHREWADVEIEDVPFAKGNEVYCFRGSLLGECETKNKVFKLAKFKEVNLRVNFVVQAMARILAEVFSKENGGEILVEYVEQSLIYVGDDEQRRLYLMEDVLDGNFTKFTGNEYLLGNYAYLSMDEKRLIEFSHWSFEWSMHNLMVVDLQGCCIEGTHGFRLTDPAIHSRNQLFGITDLGVAGFGRYFLLHSGQNCLLNR